MEAMGSPVCRRRFPGALSVGSVALSLDRSQHAGCRQPANGIGTAVLHCGSSFDSEARDRDMQVPLLDLKGQYAPLRAEIETAIREVCDEQRFILGPRVAELEAQVAAYSQTKHGLGLSSGTDALLVALMALDIGPGDEVITTPFTFFATAGVIARLGARPFFCDIDPATFNLDPAAVRATIAKRCDLSRRPAREPRTGGVVKALLPVHLYGQMADMDAFMAIARKHRLAVVEDAAQAIGAALADGRRAGSVGDVGCLSFFPTKNLGAFGDAGMCVTQRQRAAERMRILRVHGGEPKYYHARDRRQLSARRAAGRRARDQAQASRRMDARAASQRRALRRAVRGGGPGRRRARADASARRPAHLQPIRDSRAAAR